MKLAFQLKDVEKSKNSVVTVGTFDGVHRAHAEIISRVVDRARARKGRSVVVTFEPHPNEVVRKHEPIRLLTTLEERTKLVESFNVDVFFVAKFDYEFSRLSARDFYLQYLVNSIGVSEVIEGYDHHLGRDREGSIQELRKLGREFDFSVTEIEPVYLGKEVVSSTQVRRLLLAGDVEHAAELLGRPYSIHGTVVRGDARGRELGYPTANIQPDSPKKVIPKNGIYFVRVKGAGGDNYGMTSIGVRPTFYADGMQVVEVNILDFDGDLYGGELEIHFLKRLRDEQKFDSAASLIKQMDIDKTMSLQLMREYEQRSH